MNNLLFYALLTALLYYFFIYLPQQKKNINNSLPPKLTQSQFTQTEPDPIVEDALIGPGAEKCPGPIFEPEEMKKLKKEKTELQADISQKERTITGLNNSYEKLATQKNKELTDLKEQLEQKDNKLKEILAVEKQVEDLTKNIQDFTNEL